MTLICVRCACCYAPVVLVVLSVWWLLPFDAVLIIWHLQGTVYLLHATRTYRYYSNCFVQYREAVLVGCMYFFISLVCFELKFLSNCGTELLMGRHRSEEAGLVEELHSDSELWSMAIHTYEWKQNGRKIGTRERVEEKVLGQSGSFKTYGKSPAKLCFYNLAAHSFY